MENNNLSSNVCKIGIIKERSDAETLLLHISIHYPGTDPWEMVITEPEEKKIEGEEYSFSYWAKQEVQNQRSEYTLTCKIDKNHTHSYSHSFGVTKEGENFPSHNLSFKVIEHSVSFETLTFNKDLSREYPVNDSLSLTWQPLDSAVEISEYKITCGTETAATSRASCVVKNKSGFKKGIIRISGNDTQNMEIPENTIHIKTMN